MARPEGDGPPDRRPGPQPSRPGRRIPYRLEAIAMASLTAVTVDCPVCNAPIAVPLAATAETVDRDKNTVAISMTPDLTLVAEHAAEHREKQ